MKHNLKVNWINLEVKPNLHKTHLVINLSDLTSSDFDSQMSFFNHLTTIIKKNKPIYYWLNDMAIHKWVCTDEDTMFKLDKHYLDTIEFNSFRLSSLDTQNIQIGSEQNEQGLNELINYIKPL